jgi:hypothetical protein
MSVLLSIPPEVIRLKQEALARIAPRVQYAVPPMENLVNRSNTTLWDPPFKDGAEIALDGFIARIDHILKNETTNIPPSYMLQKSWHQQYDVVIVKVPEDRISAFSNTSSTTMTTGSDNSNIISTFDSNAITTTASDVARGTSESTTTTGIVAASFASVPNNNISLSEITALSASIHNETGVSGAIMHTFFNASVAAFSLNGTALQLHRKKAGHHHHRNHHNTTHGGPHGVRKEGKKVASQN